MSLDKWVVLSMDDIAKQIGKNCIATSLMAKNKEESPPINVSRWDKLRVKLEYKWLKFRLFFNKF